MNCTSPKEVCLTPDHAFFRFSGERPLLTVILISAIMKIADYSALNNRINLL